MKKVKYTVLGDFGRFKPILALFCPFSAIFPPKNFAKKAGFLIYVKGLFWYPPKKLAKIAGFLIYVKEPKRYPP